MTQRVTCRVKLMGHWRKQQIAFFMTTRCNLSCRYCYAPKLKVEKCDQRLSFEFAKKGIDDFFAQNDSRQIRYYGVGEPTMEFDLMKRIREYAYEQAGEELVVELQTNGFFSKRVADWIVRNVDILWISCDGPPEIQDYWRPTVMGGRSSGVVESNIKFFAKQGHMQVGVRATLASSMVNRQQEIVDYFSGLGIKYICAEPVSAPTYSILNDTMKNEPIEFAKGFLGAQKKAKELGAFYMSLRMVNFDEEVNIACRACVPCPQLTTDNYVSCCDRAPFGPNYLFGPLQELVYGVYDQKKNKIIYDEEKIERIRLRNTTTLEKGPCKGCKLVRHCAGGCVGEAVNETGNLYGIKADSCTVTRYLANYLPLNSGLYPCLHS